MNDNRKRIEDLAKDICNEDVSYNEPVTSVWVDGKLVCSEGLSNASFRRATKIKQKFLVVHDIRVSRYNAFFGVTIEVCGITTTDDTATTHTFSFTDAVAAHEIATLLGGLSGVRPLFEAFYEY